MQVLVLNGSPKGGLSVTMQYVKYLARWLPEFRAEIANVAQRARHLEGDPAARSELAASIGSADAVLWATPLYILLVPSQLKHFIDTAYADPALREALRGKYTGSLTTSIKFFDHCAHDYLHGLADELEMRYLGDYSARMNDLTVKTERERLTAFGRRFLAEAAAEVPLPRQHPPLPVVDFRYAPGESVNKLDTAGRRVVVLTDGRPDDHNLNAMVGRFSAALESVEVYNLHELDIKGGCLGCCSCGFSYTCAYEGKDDYTRFYNEVVKKADVLVFAGSIRARQLSWVWRRFIDRSFFNCHTPTLMDKQFGFLVAGPLGALPGMRHLYRGWIELQRGNLVDFVSDDVADSAALDARIDGLARRLVENARAHYVRPQTFLGYAGMKVFRDDLFAGLKMVFQADHKTYKRRGYYDFPHKKRSQRFQAAILTLLTKLPPIRREFPKRLKTEMVKPLRKVLAAEEV